VADVNRVASVLCLLAATLFGTLTAVIFLTKLASPD